MLICASLLVKNKIEEFIAAFKNRRMKFSSIVSGLLVWWFGLPLVSMQCSTCLEGKCHPTGECKLGCNPGYVGWFCDRPCPSGCVNSTCHIYRSLGVTTCSDGCVAGHCGFKCSRPCPAGCTTCDMSCTECNVTICTGNSFGPDCSKTCDSYFEKCSHESGKCIRCKVSTYGNECEKRCPPCLSMRDEVGYICRSGCEMCRTEELCPPKYYGLTCQLNCSRNCGSKFGSDVYHCNKATGECSEGCKPGYYGRTCNLTCTENYSPKNCNQTTGECSGACKTGYYGRTCNLTCSEQCLTENCDQTTGECIGGCKSGYYGHTCNNTCRKHCVKDICNQHNGACEFGCIQGYHNRLGFCEYDTIDVGKIIQLVLLSIIIIVLVLVLVLVVVLVVVVNCFVIFIKRKIREKFGQTDEEDQEEI